MPPAVCTASQGVASNVTTAVTLKLKSLSFCLFSLKTLGNCLLMLGIYLVLYLHSQILSELFLSFFSINMLLMLVLNLILNLLQIILPPKKTRKVYYFSLECSFLAALIIKNTFFSWLILTIHQELFVSL